MGLPTVLEDIPSSSNGKKTIRNLPAPKLRNNPTRCPICGSDSITQIASHNYPVTSVVPFIFGIWSWLFLALLPARFACRTCRTTFRRYTPGRLIPLLLFLPFILLFIVLLLFILIPSL